MPTVLALLTTEGGRWRPGIGDPTFMGWVTVVAYVVAAYLAVSTVRALREREQALRARGDPAARAEAMLVRLWLVAAVVLILLGINKQLDLQTLLAQLGRDLAKEQGWYAQRRRYQAMFVGAVALGGVGLVGVGAWALRSVLQRALGAVAGLSVLVSFVAIRAASFHHVDALLFTHPVRLNWILEIGGIGVLAVAALRARGHVRDASRGDSASQES